MAKWLRRPPSNPIGGIGSGRLWVRAPPGIFYVWRYPIGKGRGTVREHSGDVRARAGSTPARYTMYPWPSGLRRLTQVQLSPDAQVRTLQGTNFYILVIDAIFGAENI